MFTLLFSGATGRTASSFSILILYLAQNCLASSMRLFVLSLLKVVIFGASYRTLLATCTYAVVRSGHRRGTGYLKSFIFVFFLYSTGYRNFAYNLKCLTRLCCNTVQNFLVVLNTPVIEPLELRRLLQLLNSSLVLWLNMLQHFYGYQDYIFGLSSLEANRQKTA